MFLTLLAVTLLVSLAVSLFVAVIFRGPIATILDHTVAHESSKAWGRFVVFTIFVTGTAGGAEIYRLGRYVNPSSDETPPVALNTDRWIFEVYQSMVGAMQAIVWMLSIFFVITLVANVLVRICDRRSRSSSKDFSSH